MVLFLQWSVLIDDVLLIEMHICWTNFHNCSFQIFEQKNTKIVKWVCLHEEEEEEEEGEDEEKEEEEELTTS